MGEDIKNKLLIVDDENMNLKVLTHILGDDYTIYTSSNGVNAIIKAKELNPDLILMDIVMPEMDGYQVLKELKNNDELKNIPVIIISGLDSEDDEEKGLSLDAADYITKPFKNKVVKLRVRNQIQIINQMRTIEQLSRIDQLTQIHNRRYFDEHLKIEWRRAIREKTPISLLMMDLDKFKILNDTYGHPQGDVVLQKVAGIFPQKLRRPSDFAARWGGEEFVVLLPNMPLEGAMLVAENIRSTVENTDIPRIDGNPPIRTKISIGVHSLIPEVGSPVDAFILKADKALYAAKEAGRNKVMAASD